MGVKFQSQFIQILQRVMEYFNADKAIMKINSPYTGMLFVINENVNNPTL